MPTQPVAELRANDGGDRCPSGHNGDIEVMATLRTNTRGEEAGGDEQGIPRQTDDERQASLKGQNGKDDDQRIVGIKG